MDEKTLFLSWSGEKSRKFAAFLYDWIPKQLGDSSKGLRLWATFKVDDLPQGVPDFHQITQQAIQSYACLAILTRESASSLWIPFEAGILVGKGRSTFTLLCDHLQIEDIKGNLNHPLANLNVTTPVEVSIRNLLLTLNKEFELGANAHDITSNLKAGGFQQFEAKYSEIFPSSNIGRYGDDALDRQLSEFMQHD